MSEGTYIPCTAGIFIPAPIPPDNPYAEDAYPSEDVRWEWRRAIERWEHQMEYYNSAILPMGGEA